MDDLTVSINRQYDIDHERAKEFGLGLSKQGLGLAERYVPALAARIHNNPQYKKVRRPLRRFDDHTIARVLLSAGITVCADAALGADNDGVRNFRDIALWIGRHFDCHDDIELEINVGAWGIIQLETLPIFSCDPDTVVLTMTAEADEIMDGVLGELTKDNPLLRPLTEPPLPWTQVDSGGLPARYWARVPLVRNQKAQRIWRKAIGMGRMKPVLDALNYLQSPGYIINEPVLEFMRRRGFDVPQPKRGEFDTEKAWQRAVDEWRVSAQAWAKDMVTAEGLARDGRFYIPLRLEFRGRIVPIPRFHYQREDHVRGLFLFADGEPIGELFQNGEPNRALVWLMAHVAAKSDGNVWSGVEKPSKLRPMDQVLWALNNLKTLRAVGEAVLTRCDPATLPIALPDDSCQFLAACVELHRALSVGPTFITRLPIMMDASNSALQHMAAAILAAEGEYANLSDKKEPDDFYRRVAEAVWDTGERCARGLMKGRDDRSLIKAACVPNSYGSKPGSWRPKWNRHDGRWRKSFKAIGMAGAIVKERPNARKDAVFLAKLIEQRVKELAPNITRVQQFHRDMAACYAKQNKHYRWPTPVMGLEVISCYLKPIVKEFRVPLDDENGKPRFRRLKLIIAYEDKVASQQAMNAAAANFTHSMDACHLQMATLECEKEHIPLLSIHDCFGTLATRGGRLLDVIRATFRALYKNNNVLADALAAARRDLKKGTKLPILPPQGNLDLDKLLISHNAFKG